jgi:hypothetical protein
MRMQLATMLVGAVVCSTMSAFAQQLPRMVDVTAEYESFRTLNRAEAVEVYEAMPVKTRQELWTLHLVTFLRAHPELDAAQRGVVLEGLGLLATGVLDVHPSDPRWRELGGDELDRVVARAKELLPRELLRDAFYRLNDPTASSRTTSNPTRFGGVQTNFANCDCSSVEGCDPDFYICYTGRPRCALVPSYNCGPFFTYACDGTCTG